MPTRTGIRFVLANCTDPSHADEYNEWYDTYAADCTVPGLLVNALRFQNPNAAGTDEDAEYLALYDIVTPDPGTAWPETADHPARKAAKIFSEYASTAFRSTYALAGSAGPGSSAARTGVTIVLTDGSDEQMQERIGAAMIDSGLFYDASWFRFVEGTPDPADWLLVLETADADPLTAYARASGENVAPDARYAGSFRLLSVYPPGA